MTQAVVIGAGPAGLMAAQTLAEAGVRVTLCEAKPSVGRKFLMAGKSGLNLTKDEPEAPFLNAFAEAKSPLSAALRAFGPDAVQDWARALGQEVFTGSTGRVFPTVMKASPLLRSWMGVLDGLGVQVKTRWHWAGWDEDKLQFDTPDGIQVLAPKVTILALGGASWSRLGSTGAWAALLRQKGIALSPFVPANAAVAVPWSSHMHKHFGAPLKNVCWQAGPYMSRGEGVISERGLEGGGLYTVSRGLREGHVLTIDLAPHLEPQKVETRLSKPRGKVSLSNYLRKKLNLDRAKIALLHEMTALLPGQMPLDIQQIKTLAIKNATLHPIDEAISTAGGVPFSALTESLMLKELPGVFLAGEMIDWEAPTGGYLISACLATGRWAAQHALQRLDV